MIEQSDFINLAKEWEDKDKTLAEFIAEIYKDRYVEIYVGDSFEQVSTEQVSQSYPAVFCGKVISAYKECLVIQTIYVSKDRKVADGALMVISERAIRCLFEVNPEYCIQDMMLRSNETSAIYKAYKTKINYKVKKA